MPKTLRELLGKFMRQVGEIILAESDDKEISRDDVIDITIRIAQCAVERQTMAAAQLKHITPEAARARIEDAIDQYWASQKKSVAGEK